jgi:branched-chain amino acid transport system ATP-binding protein
MARALTVLREEHRSILAVLHGMSFLVQEIRARGRQVDARVFHAMIYYLDTFSERFHHPKEDRHLFQALRGRSAEAAALIDELEDEHKRGEDALRRLSHTLMRYEEGGQREFPAFEREVENFVRNYRDHIRKEEEGVFPLAREVLSGSDWAKLDIAIARDRDPLALGGDPRDVERLFHRIAEIAPPPIGLGAPSRPR